MKHLQQYRRIAAIAVIAAWMTAPPARADIVTDWNTAAGDIVTAAKIGPHPANRVMALVQAAVYEAANAVSHRYPATGLNVHAAADASLSEQLALHDPAYQPALALIAGAAGLNVDSAAGASLDAAVAAANQATLSKLLPSQQATIEVAYQAALARIADGYAKSAGIAVGAQAAAAVLAARADDGIAAESYRPVTTAGVYVPTVIPAAPQWALRKPWLLSSAAQLRPAAPPALSSTLWARDYEEIRALGGKSSANRTAQQSEIATFWVYSMPMIYHGVLRSVAERPGREVMQNARLFAAATQATDDALIAVMEAKYHYNFWRPVTAIRNGDLDGNDATQRDASWLPFIDTPMHPEYPCAHCVLAGAVGAVLKAELGDGAVPMLKTTSLSAKGAAHSWATIDEFVLEVSSARIYDGVHYRNSTEVGTALGRQIGALAAAKFDLRPDGRYEYTLDRGDEGYMQVASEKRSLDMRDPNAPRK